MEAIHHHGGIKPPRNSNESCTHLSRDKALDGIGEHDDTGKEKPCDVGHRVVATVVVEKVTCNGDKTSHNSKQLIQMFIPHYRTCTACCSSLIGTLLLTQEVKSGAKSPST